MKNLTSVSTSIFFSIMSSILVVSTVIFVITKQDILAIMSSIYGASFLILNGIWYANNELEKICDHIKEKLK